MPTAGEFGEVRIAAAEWFGFCADGTFLLLGKTTFCGCLGWRLGLFGVSCLFGRCFDCGFEVCFGFEFGFGSRTGLCHFGYLARLPLGLDELEGF